MATTFAPGTPNWVDLGTSDVAAAGSFWFVERVWAIWPSRL